jgi:hexulose-6-phosphate isomerase
MSEWLSRRGFVQAALAGAAVAARGLRGAERPAAGGQFAGKIKKAVKFHMVREPLSVADKFKLLADLGFDGVEPRVEEKKVKPKELLDARDATGLAIHGVVNGSTSDLRGAVDRATYYGATSVLVVAGGVNQHSSYDHNYKSTQETIRRALPYAEDEGIDLLIENVWNNFLLSPLEMARYIDELDSPRVGAYFDVGNVVRYGWPEQWIRILGERIGKLDIKEYSRKKQRDEGLWKGFLVEIGEGDCGWPAVRKALAEIDYRGWATAEVAGGGRQRLAEIAERMDRVLDLA